MTDPIRIDERDERVFRALIRSPHPTVASAAEDLDLLETAVLESVQRLLGLGLVQRDGETVRPVRPDLALDEQLIAAEQDLLEQHRTLMQARRDVADLVEAYSKNALWSQQAVAVERIDGGDSIQDKIDELLDLKPADGQPKEILSITTSLSFEIRSPEQVREGDLELLGAGCAMRTIMPPLLFEDEVSLKVAREMNAAGDETRIHPSPPLQLMIIDRAHAILPVDPARPSHAAMLVRAPSLLVCYVALFELTWRQSKPLLASVRESAVNDGLSVRERQLLELLNAGVTDDAAAKQMNCSVRTVRRDSDALYNRLGVRTRFQAGVEAARRGWI